MFLPAMPAAVLLQEQHVGAAALRAGNATGPAPRDQVFAAIDRVGEKDDGLLQCCRLAGFHTANLAGLLILSSILVPFLAADILARASGVCFCPRFITFL